MLEYRRTVTYMYVRVSIVFRSTILRTVPTVWCGVCFIDYIYERTWRIYSGNETCAL